MASDIYKILEVGKYATAHEIRAAYLRLASEMHPDLNSQDTAAELRFKEIQTAYEILANPRSRAEYDRNSRRRRSRSVVHAGGSPKRNPTTTTSAPSPTPWEGRADVGAGVEFINRAAIMRAKHRQIVFAAALWVTAAVVVIVGIKRSSSQSDVPPIVNSGVQFRLGDGRASGELSHPALGAVSPPAHSTDEPDVSSLLPSDQTADEIKQVTPAVPPRTSDQLGSESSTTFEFVSGLPSDSIQHQMSLPIPEIDAFPRLSYDAIPRDLDRDAQDPQQLAGQYGRAATTRIPAKGFYSGSGSGFSFAEPGIDDGWNVPAAQSLVDTFPWKHYDGAQQVVGGDSRHWAALPEERQQIDTSRTPWHVGYLTERLGQRPESLLGGHSRMAAHGNPRLLRGPPKPTAFETPPGVAPHYDGPSSIGMRANSFPALTAHGHAVFHPYGNVENLSSSGSQIEGFNSRSGNPYRPTTATSMVTGWGSAPEYRMPTLQSIVPLQGNFLSSPGGTSVGSPASGSILSW